MDKQQWLERQANIKTIEAGGFSHAITFNSNQNKITCGRLTKIVNEFEKRMNKKLKTNLKWIHFYENASGNAHFHSVVKLDDPTDQISFKKQDPHMWAKLMKNGQIWIDTYEDTVATYITKGGRFITTTA